MSVLISDLNLLYPPISNQEGVWLWEDQEVRDYLKRSKLYMLVHRKELKFVEVDTQKLYSGIFKFKISMGEFISSYFTFQFSDNITMLVEECGSIIVEQGDKLFRLTNEDDGKVIFWATPDKILYDCIKHNIELEVENKEDIQKFQNFDLLYVGISKKNDSFSRLFEKAHHGRLNILSNEYTKEEKARMTDELMILMFEVTWFNINVMKSIGDIEELNTYTDDEEAIVADAEKAFVSMMESKYNEVKFQQYPQGEDGLAEKGLEGYGYSINYDLCISTEKVCFVGKYDDYQRDAIVIKDGNVSIIKA